MWQFRGLTSDSLRFSGVAVVGRKRDGLCLPTHPDCSRFPRAGPQPQPCQTTYGSCPHGFPFKQSFQVQGTPPRGEALCGIRIVVGAAKRSPLTGRITSLPRTGQEDGLSQRRADPVTHVSLFPVERDALVLWQRYKSLGGPPVCLGCYLENGRSLYHITPIPHTISTTSLPRCSH